MSKDLDPVPAARSARSDRNDGNADDRAHNLDRWAAIQALTESLAHANPGLKNDPAATDSTEDDSPPLRRLPIDLSELDLAMESSDGTAEWYLDLHTGALLMVSTYDPEVTQEESAAIDADPDRYVAVDNLSSHDSFQIMRDFVESLSDTRAAAALDRALSERKPFRRFKDTAARFGKVYDDWHAFHNAQVRKRAIEWLESEGIDAVPVQGSKL